MERTWLRQYPAQVPAEVDCQQFPTVAALLEDAFRRHAGHDALLFMGRRLRFEELDRLSLALGAWLQQSGLNPGARVAIMLPNVPQYPIALAAVLRAGYVVTNVNPLYTPRELEHQLKDSGACAIIVLENFAATLAQVIGRTSVRHVIIASMGDLLGFPRRGIVNFAVRRLRRMVPPYSLPGAVRFNDALARGARHELVGVERGPDDIAFLQYTGGTTGVSKGAMLLNRNVVANILQAAAWMNWMLEEKRVTHGEAQISMLCALPIYHAAALVCCCLYGLHTGLLSLLIANPRDIPGVVRELSRHPVNWLPGVNTFLNALAVNPDFRRLDFSRLYLTSSGAAAVQRAVADKWQMLTGCVVRQAYGLTEASPLATAMPAGVEEFTGSVGLPLPNTEVMVMDDDGVGLAAGRCGEICIRGPQIMAGYWQRPEETAKVITADGFLRTGDIGYMDEQGYVHIVDRKKDVILVSGFNVYPNEVEDVVAMHPGVSECAAIGIPDERSGEAVKIFVVRNNTALTVEQLQEHCRRELTGYKCPRVIEFRDALPKSAVGKILRRELREAGDEAHARIGQRASA